MRSRPDESNAVHGRHHRLLHKLTVDVLSECHRELGVVNVFLVFAIDEFNILSNDALQHIRDAGVDVRTSVCGDQVHGFTTV